MNTKKNLLVALTAGASLLAAGALAIAHPGHRGGGMSIDKLDVDGDGAVSLVEFQTHAEERFARRMAKLDADQDGMVTQAEHEALVEKMKAKRRGRKHQRMQRQAPELPMSVDDMQAQHVLRVEKRFARMDTDGDGLISEGELEEAKARRQARRQARRDAPGGAL